jgi:alkanesulfonate monooxygenase SsuD/methylene tetrahydromethanopterin reductase-like flavin-dependent oxidoreductase (luciferase family)
VKLDLLYEFQPKIGPYDEPFPYGQKKAEQATYDEAIAEIRYADRLGFNTVWCVEHHFRDGRSACPSNEVVLGALSTITENLRLGFGVSLMPPGFQHPARVAEKVATVDVLSHGRVEWGTGRSTPMEQLAFGVPADDRSRDMWREAVEFVVAAWTQESLSWDTDLITFPERKQCPKPYQDPHPPAWLAAASAPSAVAAGKLGFGLLSFALMQPVEVMADIINQYRAAQLEAEIEGIQPLTKVRNDRVGAYTLVHCVDDWDTAVHDYLWDSISWWYRHLAEFTLQWEAPNLTPEEQAEVFPLLQGILAGEVDVQNYIDQDMIVVGTAEQCLEKIIRYDEAGVDQLLCYVQFGRVPHEQVLRSLELLGTKVIPELEKRGHRVDARAALAG